MPDPALPEDEDELTPDDAEDLAAPNSLQKLDRASRALKLYREGVSIRQIAQKTGYRSISGAWAAVRKAIELEVVPEVELVRSLEMKRLDWLTRVMTKAINAPVVIKDKVTGEMVVNKNAQRSLARNVEVYLKIMDRRAMMLGLDLGEKKDERIGPSVLVVYERDPNQEQRRKDVSEILDGTELLIDPAISRAALPAARLPDPNDGSEDPNHRVGGGDG